MQLRYIIIFFVTAIFAGWTVPDLLPQEESPRVDILAKSQNSPTPVDDSLDDEDDDGGWGEKIEIEIERSDDGHFYAPADVNGQAVEFLIDTGASTIALTGADAEALGLYWDDYDLQMVGRGVSGDVYGKPVVLDEVALGGFVVRNLPAAIIPEGLDRSLLGQAFLKEIDNVNIRGDQMILR